MTRRRVPKWLNAATVEAVHDAIVQRFGGAPSLRDRTLLQSAVARAEQRYHYDESADLADLAASLAFGLAKNHPFLDGNKRTAWICTALFMELNGARVRASEAETVVMMVDLASGRIDEPAFAAWLRRNS